MKQTLENLLNGLAPVGVITGCLSSISVEDVTSVLYGLATIICAVVSFVNLIIRIKKGRGDDNDTE